MPVYKELKERFPEERLLAIYPPVKEGDLLEFDFYASKSPSESKRFKVFVSSETGEILHQVDHLNSVPNFLRQIHVRLMDGFFGRQLVGLAGIGLMVVSVTGLIIYGDFMKKQFFGK